MADVKIVGAGLAGAEAAWQLAERGIKVDLYEMRPHVMTGAHQSGDFAELVCSNSLRGAEHDTAPGLLKEELRRLGSLLIGVADRNSIPAGKALAVDREEFAAEVSRLCEGHENIRVIREEVLEIEDARPLIIASGPLTSERFSKEIAELTGEEHFYFYDAAAPIVTAESIDYEKAFFASRYREDEADYLNCIMDEAEYAEFYRELSAAELLPVEGTDREVFFSGCMPIEVMAEKGERTLLFGPLKPVGLTDPKTGKEPFAVVQLRRDNREGTLYNLVGFQTRMKWSEQQRVFSLIPALRNAEFMRYGVMHRNSFIDSPRLLTATGKLKTKDNIYFAGQISGVEGYIESIAGGMVAALNVYRLLKGGRELIFPKETAIGALMNYIATFPDKNFQPMNVNFGLFPPLDKRIRNKKERNLKVSERALAVLEEFGQKEGIFIA